jgi:hypothetical protein
MESLKTKPTGRLIMYHVGKTAQVTKEIEVTNLETGESYLRESEPILITDSNLSDETRVLIANIYVNLNKLYNLLK